MRRIAAAVVCLLIGACGPTSRGDDDGDDGSGTPDANTGPTTDACIFVAVPYEATQATAPVDILWVIDNSGSMGEEEDRVQDNMNNFAMSIAASGVDYHVIVITDTGHVNVPPPLGG